LKTTVKYLCSAILILFVSNSVIALEIVSKKNPAKERAEIDKMANKALSELYKNYPDAKRKMANAKGYAIFSNTGINLLVVSSGNGCGKAVSGGKATYMKMYSAGVGAGAGVKKYYGIFVFKTTKAYNNFINEGWQAGGQADAAAKDKKQGASVENSISISPDITYYQVTQKGIAVQATVQGTKYWKDKDLN